MSITVKAIIAVILLAVAGVGAVYYLRVENRIQVEAPPPGAPADKSRQELAEQYRQKAGTQDDLKPLDWAAKSNK